MSRALLGLIAFFIGIVSPCAQTTWLTDSDSVWQIATNWNTGVVPSGAGTATLLGSAITADRTIRLGDNVFVGALTISSANSYKISGLYDPEFSAVGPASATLTVAGGGSPTITSVIDLPNNLVITQNSSGVLRLMGDINVAQKSVTKWGTGVVEMTGNGYFGNGLIIREGTYRVYAEPALGNGTNGTGVTINGGTLNIGANVTTDGAHPYTVGSGGGTISVDSGSTFTLSNGTLLAGSGGTLTNSGAGTLVLSGDSSASFAGSVRIINGTVRIVAEKNLGYLTNGVTLAGGTLNVGNSFTASSGKVITVTGTGGTLDIDRNQTLTFATAGQLSGSGALTKAGLGTLTLSGDNSATFTGNTTINAGTVRVTAENNLGNLNNDVTLNGGTLNVGGTFTSSAGKTITATGTGGTLSIDSGATLTLGTTSQLLGSAALTVSGAGTLSVTANENAFTGNVTISGGNLSLSGNGTATGIGTFTITDRGTLVINDGSSSLDRIKDTSSVTLNGGTVRYISNGNITETAGSLTLAGGSSSIEINSATGRPILTFGSLTRTGADATVSFVNTGSGTLNNKNNPNISFTTAPTLVNGIVGGWATIKESTGSTLEFLTMNGTSVNALGAFTTGVETSWTNATLNAKPSANITLTADRNLNTLTLADTRTLNLGTRVLTLGAGGLIAQGTSTISNGTLTVGTSGTGGTLFAHVDGGGTLTDSAVLANNGGGTVNLAKAGAGTMIVSGANTYTGATYVNEGVLQLGAAGVIADSSAVTVATGATFDLNGNSESVGSIAGGGSITNSSGTLTAGGNNGSTTFSGVISGAGGLTKAGSGTLTSSGVNTYTGNTTINAGTLSVSQDANLGAGTSAVVFGGGTLNASESFTANASRVLTMTGNGTVDVNSGKTLTFTSASDLTGTGNLTKSGAGTLTLGGATSYTGNFVMNGGELKVQGAATDVDSLLSSTRVSNLTGSGGTLTWAYTNENYTNTINFQPTSASNIKIGFDAVGTTNTWYVLGPNNNNLNWAGLAVKGGNVNLSSDHTLVGTSATTLDVSGGYLYLAGGNPSGGKTLTISGDANLTGGYIYGGPGGGSHGTLVTSGNINSSGTILLNGPNITMNPNNGVTTSISGTTPLNGVFQFVKQGGGTVVLNQSMTVSDFLQITSGTLLLGASDRLNDNLSMIMQGGTFATGGFQDTVGTLTLTGGAALDLGSGNGSMLAFADSHSNSWSGYTLSITNYLDSSEKIYFGTTTNGLTSGQLSQVVWYNPYGTGGIYTGATIDFDGRIRPAPLPVPEPKTVVGIILLSAAVGWRERKLLRKCGDSMGRWLLAAC